MTRTLLSVAALGLLTAAPAFAQDTVRVPVNDLDLSTRAGVVAFDARVAAEARNACLRGSRSIPNAICIRRVQREVLAQLPQARQDDYARARRTGDIEARAFTGWAA
ncbi:MAG: UrcA family protein [Brevundimonas sp.]|uniref:UrcA family protein n=1 Tax=Brevundimonas sp. TaxID=1871086 RepID=UPI004033C52A